MDKLAAMHTFIEIVDRGSLTAAGEALNKSLPTVVRTLAELERTLGVVLLRRTTRRQSLTDEGRVYLERCRRILADIDETEALVSIGHGEPRGALRVTAPVMFGQMHVAPAVLEFVQRFAQVKVDLLLLDRVVNLVEEGIDVAVRIGALGDSSHIVARVGDMRQVVVASPKRLRRDGSPKHPRELAERECIGFHSLDASNWRFHDHGRDLSVAVTGRLSYNHVAPAMAACVAGLGYGQFLAYQVAPAVRAKQLRIVLRQFERRPMPVSLVYPETRLLSPRLRAFLDWMKPRLAEVTGGRVGI